MLSAVVIRDGAVLDRWGYALAVNINTCANIAIASCYYEAVNY